MSLSLYGEISHQNIIGATLVFQICVIGILFIGVWLMDRSSRARWAQGYIACFLAMALPVTALALTESNYQSWSGFLEDISHLGNALTIPDNLSLASVFFVNILILSWFIHQTGGSRNSPFTPILFVIPTLAIFLYEPPKRFLFYAVLIAIVYFATSKIEAHQSEGTWEPDHTLSANRFVNLACLILSALIGYITRPQG